MPGLVLVVLAHLALLAGLRAQQLRMEAAVSVVQVHMLALPTPTPTPTPTQAQAQAQARPTHAATPRPVAEPHIAPRPVVSAAARQMTSAAETSSAAGEISSAPVPATALPAPSLAAPAAPNLQAPRFDAAYLNNPAPDYPALSRRLGEEGKVVLRVFVAENGRPAQIELKTSSGSPRLDQAALSAVGRWQFVAARRGEEAVAAWVLVPLIFNLRG